MKTLRLFIIIFCLSYFIGMLWLMACEITKLHTEQEAYFLTELEGLPNYDSMVLLTYYAFTTLSTVGLGDFHPQNSIERLVCSGIMLFGVMATTYLIESFSLMVKQL